MSVTEKRFDTNLIFGRPGTHPWGVEHSDALLAKMDQFGIEQGFVSHITSTIYDPRSGNTLLFSALGPESEGRLRPVPVIRLRDLPVDDVWTDWRSRGVCCVRVCPAVYKEQTIPSEFLSKLRDALEQFGCFLNVGLVPFYGSASSAATVSDAARLADAIAPIPLMLTGLARKNITEAEELLGSRANAIVDVGNLTTGTAVENLVAGGFEDRLVCGSGFGISYAMQFPDVVAASNISEETIDRILYSNAHKLMTAK